MTTLTPERPQEATAPEVSRGQWRTSYEVAEHPVPTGKEEAWRFTPVKKLKPLFEDGEPVDKLALEITGPAGHTFGDLHEEVARNIGKGCPADRPAALAASRCGMTRHVTVPEGYSSDEQIELTFTGTGGTYFDHLVISVADQCAATIAINHVGTGMLSQLVSIVVGEGSTVTIVSNQAWDEGAVHLSQQDITACKDATITHVVTTTGGDVVRVSSNVHYAGPGATANLYGTYYSQPGQHQEHRSFVDHSEPHCTSDVLYKGALDGKGARTVWVGDVLIRATATGTETFELNRNLLLSPGGRADSIPNLEIETGEIEGAGHASATGRFDDEQLFYLMARGITEAEARQLVVRGFFADIVGRIGVNQITDAIMATFEDKLSKHNSAAEPTS